MDNKRIWIGVAAVVLVVAGFFVAVRNGGSEPDTQERGNSYFHPDFNILFERPDGYSILEVDDPENNRFSIVLSQVLDTQVPENGEGPTAITIDVFQEVTQTDAGEWVRSNAISNFGLATSEMTPTTVAGAPAVSYSWDGLYPGRSVAFIHQGNVILVSGTYMDPADPIYSDFDKVLSSIQLR